MLLEGILHIYKNDLDNQRHYIDTICKDVRGKKLDILYDLQAFYVPNNDYMIEHFGHDIMNPKYDCYTFDGFCKWSHHLVIPIRDVSKKIVGFTGYNPYVKLAYDKENKTKEEEEVAKMPRYKESSVLLMDKSKFFICPLGMKKAIEDGYIIVIDGVFDAISLAEEGFNSFCILGSTLTDEMKFCLSFVDVIYVAYDNDLAGKKLYDRIKLSFPRVLAIRQRKCKDIDDFIKKYPGQFKLYMQAIFNKVKTSIMLDA